MSSQNTTYFLEWLNGLVLTVGQDELLHPTRTSAHRVNSVSLSPDPRHIAKSDRNDLESQETYERFKITHSHFNSSFAHLEGLFAESRRKIVLRQELFSQFEQEETHARMDIVRECDQHLISAHKEVNSELRKIITRAKNLVENAETFTRAQIILVEYNHSLRQLLDVIAFKAAAFNDPSISPEKYTVAEDVGVIARLI